MKPACLSLVLGVAVCALNCSCGQPVDPRPPVRIAIDETFRSMDSSSPVVIISIYGPQAMVLEVNSVVTNVTLTNQTTGVVTLMTGHDNNYESVYAGSTLGAFSSGPLPQGVYTLTFSLADWGVAVDTSGFATVSKGVLATTVYLTQSTFRLTGVTVCGGQVQMAFSENLPLVAAGDFASIVTITQAVQTICSADPAYVTVDGMIGGGQLVGSCNAKITPPFSLTFSESVQSIAGHQLGSLVTGRQLVTYAFQAPSQSENGCDEYSTPQ